MNQTQQVVLDELRAECQSCGREFVENEFPDFAYGVKLLRSCDGRVAAFINCLANSTFDDFVAVVERVAGKQSDRHKLASMVDVALGVCCDPVNGKSVSVTQRPVCPYCGSREVDEFDFRPPRTVVMELTVATYYRWLEKSREDRESAVASQLRAAGFV